MAKIKGKSKLTASEEQETSKTVGNKPLGNLGIIEKKKSRTPRSFRFTNSDLEKLRDLTKEVNELSESMNFNETDVVRALIQLGKESKAPRIIKAFKNML